VLLFNLCNLPARQKRNEFQIDADFSVAFYLPAHRHRKDNRSRTFAKLLLSFPEGGEPSTPRRLRLLGRPLSRAMTRSDSNGTKSAQGRFWSF
jgi:hypothetical protein